MNALRIIVMTLFATWAIGSAGCAPAATYPPTEGSTSLGPSAPPLPELMAEAMRYAHAREGRGEPLIVNLPPNTPPDVWDEVLRRLPKATPMRDPGELAFHVRQVRKDGGKAEVDVIYRRENFNQLMTVAFEGAPFRPWRAIYNKKWRIPVETPGPTYSQSAMDAFQRSREWFNAPDS
jgi:hypothetical protein